MYFYIDESGNSGNNIFDKAQPILSYGVLSARTDVDVRAVSQRSKLQGLIGRDSLHANELGERRLASVAHLFVQLQRELGLRFDYYFIHKPSFAVVTFFNAVFDAGLNDAVKWDWYWTPLRFPLVVHLYNMLDEDILRESWALCLVPKNRIEQESQRIEALLSRVLEKVENSPLDDRTREVFRDGLKFAIKHPLRMDFGIYSQTALSPNTVGFQFVLQAIARRQKSASQDAIKITVDRQSQFNPAQRETYDIQSRFARSFAADEREKATFLSHPFFEGARDEAETLISHFPKPSLTISESAHSFGLQLTDIYLWLINRCIKDDYISRELSPLITNVFQTGVVDGISVSAMMRRWEQFEQGLPPFSELTAEQRELNDAQINEHREKIRSLNLDTP